MIIFHNDSGCPNRNVCVYLSDVYTVLELDSYGHFFHQARTKMIIKSMEPQWEEDFHIELEGTRGMRILLYEEDSKQVSILKGKAELEVETLYCLVYS